MSETHGVLPSAQRYVTWFSSFYLADTLKDKGYIFEKQTENQNAFDELFSVLCIVPVIPSALKGEGVFQVHLFPP